MKNLIVSVADYCHYVQRYLSGIRGWSLGTDYAEMTKYYTSDYDLDQIESAVADQRFVKTIEGPNIEKITYSLILDSTTTIRVYIQPASTYTGTFTATLDGTACSVVRHGERYAVEIKNIPAHLLSTTHSIVITADETRATVSVSAVSYVYSLLNSSTHVNNTDAYQAAAALYAYATAAKEYLS